MPVPTSFADLDTTASLNSPQNSESPKGQLDDYLRSGFALTKQLYNTKAETSALTAHIDDTSAAHAASAIAFTPTGAVAATTVQAAIAELDSEKALAANVLALAGGTLTGALNEAPAVTIASAATVNIGAAASNNILITGTTTITAFDAIAAGAKRTVTFSGALLLTHNATSFILPSAANITTAAGDVAWFVSLGGGNWRCVMYMRASGAALTVSALGIALGTPIAATAVTSIDITGIPSTAKRIKIRYRRWSANGASWPVIRLGTAGGIEATGYAGTAGLWGATAGYATLSTGFQIGAGTGDAGNSYSGIVELLLDGASNEWVCDGKLGLTNNAYFMAVSGDKTLSGVLDRVRITTSNGTDTFDAGTVNISWE